MILCEIQHHSSCALTADMGKLRRYFQFFRDIIPADRTKAPLLKKSRRRFGEEINRLQLSFLCLINKIFSNVGSDRLTANAKLYRQGSQQSVLAVNFKSTCSDQGIPFEVADEQVFRKIQVIGGEVRGFQQFAKCFESFFIFNQS